MSSQVQKAKISPTSDEYVLDQLSVCEEKVLKLLEELDQTGRDVGDISKQMKDEEVTLAALPTQSLLSVAPLTGEYNGLQLRLVTYPLVNSAYNDRRPGYTNFGSLFIFGSCVFQ